MILRRKIAPQADFAGEYPAENVSYGDTERKWDAVIMC